jgi:3-methyladenine DNA glycosylase Tag
MGNRKQEYWRALDLVSRSFQTHMNDAGARELRKHSRKTPRPLPGDREIMRRIVIAISYSQGSQSKLVKGLIDDPIFSKAFVDFDISALANQKPEALRQRYWTHLGYLRFKKKIDRIIRCAQVLNGIVSECGNFATYLSSFKIPRRLHAETDINKFWDGFTALRQDLRTHDMPFFRQTTSLLQLLLDLDYDSVKPDLIVMRLARRIGMVEFEIGEAHLQKVVRGFQKYAIARNVRLSAVDLQVLAFGGQTSACELLDEFFCPSSDPCQKTDCPVGKNGLCEALAIAR